MNKTVREIIAALNEFYQYTEKDNHRYLSWEHCYEHFYLARNESPNVDYLSLQLAFYLASWGMYRGSSFLLQCDYKVHIPAVEEILKSKYDCLQNVECREFLNNINVRDCLKELINELSEIYKKVREDVTGKSSKEKISDILITKILLGTLGCTPAYDRFFNIGVKQTNVLEKGEFSLSLNSIRKLAEFYKNNAQFFEMERVKIHTKNKKIIYPQMKLLDMALWNIGTKNT
ncbi:hypothetical protein [Haemophilus sputorum]|uniref:hypothetical protein n=1 Tax=Haemophilus sputorum TaxID=1078480 RepID=UPI0028D14194|nr:hypothetical protein [Haemophilus sputorum]